MMGSSLRLMFLATLGLGIAWSSFLIVPSFTVWVIASDADWYVQAFPHPSEEGGAGKVIGDWAYLGAINSLMPEAKDALISVRPLLRRHLRVSGDWLPFFPLIIGASILPGLLVRERLTLGTAYASPTISYLAKRLVGAVLLSFVIWSFAPVAAPYWVFYLLVFAGMAGCYAYVSNLPLRL